MAQSGFTPIKIYSSPTTTNVPLAANLAAGELAINTADGKLFYKDSGGVVQVIGTKGGVGSSSTTQVLYNSSGAVVGSANMTFNGTTLTSNTLNLTNALGTAYGGTGVTTSTGSGSVVLSTSPTLVTPALGTPTSGTVTNLTGTASININGTVGATTPATGSFTNITGSANAIISVTDNTNAALRITQLGTGNALLVEDSANPDSTPVVIDATGNVALGSTTATERLNLVSDGRNFLQLTRASADSNQSVISFRKARGTNAAPTIITNNDAIGDNQYYGYDGTQFIQAASVQAIVDGTPGTNDMPGRLVFSTTADGASSPTERMRIDSAGNVGISASALAGVTLYIPKAQTGATSATTVYAQMNPAADVTSTSIGYTTFALNGVGASTTNFFHYNASQGTFAGTAPTSQYGFNVSNLLTGATNNYGFHSNIPAAANRYNIYAQGTADNYFAGKIGIGALVSTADSLLVSPTASAVASVNGIRELTIVDQTTTTTVNGVISQTRIASPAAVNAIYRFYALQSVFTGTVTTQYGFVAASNLTGATNNYGFISSIPAGTNQYNFYAQGTADNYFAGSVGIGTTAPNASALLDVQSTTKGVRMPNMTTTQKNAIASPAAGLMVFDTTLAKLCVYTGSAWQTITST